MLINEDSMKEEKKVKTVPCPKCRQPAQWENNPFRPFCCERCSIEDLAGWADNSYSVPSEDVPSEEELNQTFH